MTVLLILAVRSGLAPRPMTTAFVGTEPLRLGVAKEGLFARIADSRSTAASSVHGLLAPCCPTAIGLGVGPVVVDPVKGVRVGWSWAHVGVEHFEVKPLATHGNATSAVVLEGMVGRVEAPLLHRVPDSVLSVADLPMSSGEYGASASKDAFPLKAGPNADIHTSAMAPALVYGLPSSVEPKETEDGPPIEDLSREIGVCGHGKIVAQDKALRNG